MRQPIPFGKYLLLERISVGGMAEVFKAKSFGVEGFEKIIAIKRILPSIAEDTEFITMFVDEAKIAGQLSHANICQIFELGKINDSHFIAMEFVWGKDVLQIQNRFRKLRQTMPVEMAAFIGAKLCEGLDYAHRKKDAFGRPLHIIHRDVSPQNILVSYEGEVKLIDFGIAKAASRSSKTQAGVLKGKFGYMSPEQVRGLPLDRRSDLFAVGTILYELMTSERLFLGESDFSTLERVRNVDIQPPSYFNKAIPPEIEKIVMKALAKDVEDRYQWANELQEDLVGFLMGREPVFTAKQLSAWMKENFREEMERERALLEQYKKVGRDGKVAGPPSAPPPGAGGTEEIHEEPETLDERADKTVIGGPSFLTEDVEPVMRGRSGGQQSFGDESPTEIFGEVATDGAASLPSAKTAILEGGSSAAPEARAAAGRRTPLPMPAVTPRAPSVEVALSQPTTPPPPPRSAGGPAPGLAGGPAPGLAAGPAPGFAGSSPGPLAGVSFSPPGVKAIGSMPNGFETAAVPRLAPVGARARGSSIWKDVAIGVGVALLVVGLVGTGWFLLRKPAAPGAPAVAVDQTGTIAIAAADTQPAEVFVNGVRRGTLTDGEPMKIEGLEPGIYDIVLKRAGAADCAQKVALGPRGTEVVMCRFAPAREPSRLILLVKPETATVYVNNAEISEAAVKEPMVLEPNVPHAIRVEHQGYEPQSLQVTLRAGETLQRTIELAPSKRDDASRRERAREAWSGEETSSSEGTGAGGAKGGSAGEKAGAGGAKGGSAGEKAGAGGAKGGNAGEKAGAGGEKAGTGGDKGGPGGEKAGTGGEKAGLGGEKAGAGAEKPVGASRREKPLAKVDGQPAERGMGKADDTKPPREEEALPEGEPKSDEPGYLIANTTPWARVWIDNKDTGKMTPIAPRAKIPLKPGRHTVTFVIGDKKFSYPIVIEPGKDHRLIKKLPVDEGGSSSL